MPPSVALYCLFGVRDVFEAFRIIPPELEEGRERKQHLRST